MKAIINNIEISSIAAWLPTRKIDMDSMNDMFGENSVAETIRTTGIKQIRLAEPNETASDLCYNAAISLIEKDAIDTSLIDGLVFASQTADYIVPSTSVILQDRLKLSRDTVCIDIHYGCSGYIYGIFQAALWIQSGACQNVLVLAGDTTSRLIHPKDRSLRLVFGECGTATLVSRGDHPMGFTLHSDGSGANELIVPAGGFRLPISEKTSEFIADDECSGRTKNDLYMDGTGIFTFAVSRVPRDIDNLLSMVGWQKDDVDVFALHQANKFIVDYLQKKINVPSDKVPVNVALYGNTGPASIPLLLSDLYSTEHQSLKKVIMSGFGVGLSWGSIASNLENTRFYEPVNK